MRNVKWQYGKVVYADRCQLLKQKGMVIWLTGLPGSGKSTIAIELEKQLFNKGHLVYRLDGDNVRHGLNADLEFGEKDRSENIRRVAEVARLFCDAGVIILASFVSPHRVMRAQAKKIIGKENFIEVYVKASLDTCKKRDPKGFYKKAAKGEIEKFTGVDACYEEPLKSDIIVNTEKDGVSTVTQRIIDYIICKIL